MAYTRMSSSVQVWVPGHAGYGFHSGFHSDK